MQLIELIELIEERGLFSLKLLLKQLLLLICSLKTFGQSHLEKGICRAAIITDCKPTPALTWLSPQYRMLNTKGDVEMTPGPTDGASDLSFSPVADYLSASSWDGQVIEGGRGGFLIISN